MTDQIKTVYVSKHALTKGIFSMQGEVSKQSPSIVFQVGVRYPKAFTRKGFYWHETFEEAKEQAEKMRLKKIASLKKQITELENLKFVMAD